MTWCAAAGSRRGPEAGRLINLHSPALLLLPVDWQLVVSHPVATLQVGSVVIIAAMVNRTFRSSMEVGGQGTGGCKGGFWWAGA